MNENKENQSKSEPDCSSSSNVIRSKPTTMRNRKKPEARGGPHNHVQSREENFINEKLSLIKRPLVDLQPIKYEEKFMGRYRLFVGNLSNDVTKEEFGDLFQTYGEINDVFVQPSKNFGFVRMDYLHNSVRAKTQLNNYNFKGRKIVIRFSPVASIRVKNLSPFVSNELLYTAFSVFGDVESCFIVTDPRGKSLEEGVVDFHKKSGATLAKKICNANMFLVTSSLKPIVVEDYEPPADVGGLPEEHLQVRRNPEYYQSRENGPRFAPSGSFEYNYGQRFKELYNNYKLKMNILKENLFVEEQKLEADMRKAQFDHETERLKELLRQREMDRERYNQQWIGAQVPPDGNKSDFKPMDGLYMQASQLTSILETEERQLQEQEWQMEFINPRSSYENYSKRSFAERKFAALDSDGSQRNKRSRY